MGTSSQPVVKEQPSIETVSIISKDTYLWLMSLTKHFDGDETDLNHFMNAKNVKVAEELPSQEGE